jgi:tetratricopeptide (TPR) repeat protein
MVNASPAGTLNVTVADDSLAIFISPNTEINDSLIVTVEKKRYHVAAIRLKPMLAFHEIIPFPYDKNMNFTVAVGKNLLYYTSDQESQKTDRPSRTYHNQDYSDSEHLFRLAEDEHSMRNYRKAMEYYLACLQKQPTHSGALTKVAELHYRRTEYHEGLRFALKVLENDTYDGGANFISGVIHKRIGNLTKAEEYFSVAARTMEYRSGAYLEIAGIKMLLHDYNRVIEFAGKALEYNRFNIPAYELLAAGYRMLDERQEAQEAIDKLLEVDPLNHCARFEQYMLNPDETFLQQFKSAIRNELPHETYLELALSYANLGLENEAIRILEQSPSYPIVYYWLSYLYRDMSPGKSIQYLSLAEELPAYFVFPYRLETIPILDWAMKQHMSWKPAYYLGLIYWHIGRIEAARELLEQCGDTPEFAPFYLVRGMLFQHENTPVCLSCSDFNRAVQLNPEEWRTWHYYINFLQSRNDLQQQFIYAKKACERFPENPVIGIDYAKALLHADKPADCLDLLEKVVILPQEGAHEGHDIFEAANLKLALDRLEKKKYREAIQFLDDSRNWPENLGAGKPYEPDTRLQDYVSAYCYGHLGNRKRAEDYLNRIISFSDDHWGNPAEPANAFISVLVLQDHKKHAEVKHAMDIWKAEQDSLLNWKISPGSESPEFQWVLAKYNHEPEKAAQLENDITADANAVRFSLFLKMLSIINNRENED